MEVNVYLYVASTQYLFGSTVYPAHAETSNWQVNFGPQTSNMGSIGIRVNIQ
jgi:hypothetical protein